MLKRVGFTLIELLIVVAIIAILAAIAVPNFLEAQTRSKVSRVKADLRTLTTAIEVYRTDSNTYPLNKFMAAQRSTADLAALTTPVAYLSSNVMNDPFASDRVAGTYFLLGAFGYFNYGRTPASASPTVAKNWIDLTAYGQYACNGWSLVSWGPDRTGNGAEWSYIYRKLGGATNDVTSLALLYDPTNGTVSSGDIIKMGGEAAFVPNKW